jgi:hypothetical protein
VPDSRQPRRPLPTRRKPSSSGAPQHGPIQDESAAIPLEGRASRLRVGRDGASPDKRQRQRW